MNVVLRLLGIELLARLAARLPGGWARLATAVLLVAVNLLPVWAVLEGRAGMGDVFLVYWFENVVVWACGIVRVATAQGIDTMGGVTGRRTGLAPFFALHYGVFTLGHGFFAVFMAVVVGLEGGIGEVLLLSLLIAVSHLVSLAVNWFGRGERLVVGAGTAAWAPYPRMLVLHVGIILGFVFIGGPNSTDHGGQVNAVAVLCGMKTLVDLLFHLGTRRRRAVPDEGLYGAAAS
jgi:hypothetical protein